MNINDLVSSISSNLDVNRLLDINNINPTAAVEATENFSNVLNSYLDEDADLTASQTSDSLLSEIAGKNSTDYKAIAEDLMNTSSGREVLYRLSQTQLASIVTETSDNDSAETLNNILTAANDVKINDQQ